MKKLIKPTLLCILLFSLISIISCTALTGTGAHTCADANKDGVCDTCSKALSVTCTEHEDEDNDGKCDVCSQKVDKKMDEVAFSDLTCTYDGKKKKIEVSGAPKGAKISYSADNEYTDAGEYTVTATVKAKGYEDAELTATLTIEPAEIEIEWADELGPYSPNGNKPSLEYTIVGAAEGDEIELDISFGKFDFTKEGSFKATASSKNPNYVVKSGSASVTVSFIYAVYTVSFDTGIENRKIDPEEILDGEAVEEPNAPYNHGKELVGWFFEGEAWDFSAPVTENMTLTAVWALTEYKINYNLDGGENSSLNPETYTVETELTFASPARAGKVFHGWYTDPAFTKPAKAGIEKGSSGEITLYANWTCDKTIDVIEKVDATPLRDGYIKSDCTVCHTRENIERLPATNSIKILAIGNSFSIAIRY